MLKHKNPVQWPDGIARNKKPKVSRTKNSMLKAFNELHNEIRLSGIRVIFVSHNYGFTAGYAYKQTPADTGISLAYYDKHNRIQCMASDKYFKGSDNVMAIAKAIMHYRKIKESGVKSGALSISQLELFG